MFLLIAVTVVPVATQVTWLPLGRNSDVSYLIILSVTAIIITIIIFCRITRAPNYFYMIIIHHDMKCLTIKLIDLLID